MFGRFLIWESGLQTERDAGEIYDAIIIGSGFGGSMVAQVLVNAGQKVLMLERGDWVSRGPHNWDSGGSVELTPHYSQESPYLALAGAQRDLKEGNPLSSVIGFLFSNRRNEQLIGGYHCVGGPSVFYGGVSMRLRERDFEHAPEIVEDSGAEWPYDYDVLEPYYEHAERILNVAGEPGADPTEPGRRNGFPQALNGLAKNSRMVKNAAEQLNLRPFRLPLAINYHSNNGQLPCVSCTTCDTYACSIGAKNDLATAVLPKLMQKGMDLRANTLVTRLVANAGSVSEVECFDKNTSTRQSFRARKFILSAGALASPHLLLASGLDKLNPGARVIGRYLTRHCNAITFGIFPFRTDPKGEFHKQLGIHDFYFGHSTIQEPSGKLGGIQQLQTPPIDMIKNVIPRPWNHFVANVLVPRMTGLLVIAEDQPRYDNHVKVNWNNRDRFGLPRLEITHNHTTRDYQAREALISQAKKVLHKAGAFISYIHHIKTFSHAVGTVRMGINPETSALDEYCNFRGVDNLYVVDGSFMPRSSGLNPSLTISANALRVGTYLVESGIN